MARRIKTRGPVLFKETEVRRLIRAVRVEGLEPAGVRLGADGAITILTTAAPDAAEPQPGAAS